MKKRSRMGIKNGIVLMERFPECNYMLTLGTGFSHFNSFDFIKKYHDKIYLIKSDFINLVKKEAYTFLSKSLQVNLKLIFFPPMPNNRCYTLYINIE